MELHYIIIALLLLTLAFAGLSWMNTRDVPGLLTSGKYTVVALNKPIPSTVCLS